MKITNSVTIKVFCKPEENQETIKQSLLKLLPFSLEQEKLQLTHTKATGFNDREISIFEITLSKDNHISQFIKHLKSLLSADTKQLILRQLETRLDEEFNFFIRLDKDRLINDNLCYITDSGSCFHIKINIAAFPKKREAAIKVIRSIFEEQTI
jgi:RNA binding exosome subunit